jgi:uncharacterized membrane protein YfcA
MREARGWTDFGITLIGVVGFLGLLAAARLASSDESQLGSIAFIWFFGFAGLKFALPWILSRRRKARRQKLRSALG